MRDPASPDVSLIAPSINCKLEDVVLCPLCQTRKARRACPALARQICAVCCGTKRLVEIDCPPDCGYLAAAREHPPAAVLRRNQDDLAAVGRLARDLNERQSWLLFRVLAVLAEDRAGGSSALALPGVGRGAREAATDAQAADAAAALAATYETSARGIIYQHPAASPGAERLAGAIKAALAEAGRSGGTAFERDAALVLRRVEAEAREHVTAAGAGSRRFLELVGRVTRRFEQPAPAPRPLIVP